MSKYTKYMEKLFYHKLCCRPDLGCNIKFKTLGMFVLRLAGVWYNLTEKIAFHYHKKNCDRCRSRYQ